MKRLVLVCLMAWTGAKAAPQPVEASRIQTLGTGLTYVRLVHLPADLPVSSAAAERGAVILDLRGTDGDDRAARTLSAWIRFHAKVVSPVFLLVNDHTSGAYQDMVTELSNSNLPFLIFGPADLGDTVDVTVNTTEQQDRLACEAIARGEPLATLAEPKIDKVRHDEAELDRDLRQGIRPDDSDDTEDLKTPEPKGPLVDLVLARAVQVDRALVALGRLPKPRG